MLFNTLLFLSSLAVIVSSKLYQNGENGIQVITQDNYTIISDEESIVWMTEFFISWCGHCQRFVPVYKALAESVKGWKKVLRPAAMDCSLQINGDICNENHVKSVPDLRLIAPLQNFTGTERMAVKIETTNQTELLRSKLAMNLVSFQNEGYQLNGCPNLDPFNTLGYNKFLEKYSNVGFYLLLFLAEDDPYLGTKMILDFCHISEDHTIPILPIPHNDSLVESFGVSSLPQIVFKVKGQKYKTLMKSNDRSPKTVHRIIKDIVEKMYQVDVSKEEPLPPGGSPSLSPGDIYLAPEGVYMEDLEKSLHDFLTTEFVHMYRQENGDQEVLVTYLSTLRKYMPYRKQVLLFLEKLLDFIEKNGIQNGSDMPAAMEYLSESGYTLPKHPHYVACRGSQPRWRGYPCSVWTTFHTLLTNEYLRKSDEEPGDVMESVRAIHGFVKSFLGCTECAQNFLKDYNVTEKEIKGPRDPIMWLWRKHNRVNKRLAGDVTEDPLHQKVFFPSKEKCPQCFITNSNATKDDEVFEFLVDYYGPDSIISESYICIDLID